MTPISRLRIRARSAGGGPWTRRWFSMEVPPVGVSRRPRIERRVDFPQPEGPAIATYSPLLISRWMPESACVSTSSVRNTLVTLSSLRRGWDMGLSSGYDTWLKGWGDRLGSFLPERDHRLDPCRAKGWKKAGSQRHETKGEGRGREHGRIGGGRGIEEGRHQPAEGQIARQPGRDPEADEEDSQLEDQGGDVARRGAERHANPELGGALGHGESQDAVDAQHREDHGEAAEDGQEDHRGSARLRGVPHPRDAGRL